MDIGCFNRPWAEYSLDAAVAGITSAGYDCMGLMRQRNSAGEPFHLISAETPRSEALSLVRGIRSSGLDLKVVFGKPSAELVELLSYLSVPILLAAGGDVEELRTAAKRGEDRNVRVLIKPHKGPYPTGRDCMDLVRKVDSPAFGIAYDPGNVANAGGSNPVDEVGEVARDVHLVCIKDFDGESPFVLPGRGKVDFAGVLSALRGEGFQGPLLVETLPKGSVESLNKAARDTRRFLSELLDMPL